MSYFPKPPPSNRSGIIAALEFLYRMFTGGITNVYAKTIGLIAHDDADTAQNRPNKQGYKYEAALNAVSTDGDVSDGKCDQYGRQHVREVTLDGMVKADDAAFAVEADKIMPVGGIATTDQVNANDAGGFGMTIHREQYVQPRSGGNAQTIDGDGNAYATLRNGAAAIGDDPARPLSAQLSDGTNNIGGTAAAPVIAQLSDGGALIDTGQETMANSLPVALASDQPSIPVTATISGEPDVDLTAVGGAAFAQGQRVKASSLSVTVASDDEPNVDLTAVGGAAFAQGQRTAAQSISVCKPSDADNYDATYNADKVLEQNDLAQQYDSPPVEHVDSAALADDTYNYYVTMGAFSSLAIHAKLDAFTTLTVEQSYDDAAAPDYEDITKALYDRITNANNNANYNNQSCILELHASRGSKIKLKAVVNGGGGAGTAQIHTVRSHGGV